MIVMNNNLEKMIRASGLQKKVVAERKGVTPETLSRHIHEKVPFTLRDAEEYADILGCIPHQISYKSDPIKIVGKVHIENDEKKNGVAQIEFEVSKTSNKLGYVFINSFHTPELGAILYTTSKDYIGPYMEYANGFETIQLDPINENRIDKECIQKLCWVKFKEPQSIEGQMKLFTKGYLYPEYGGLHTVAKQSFYNGNNVYKGLELEWATPVLTVVIRPDLREVSFVDNAIEF